METRFVSLTFGEFLLLENNGKIDRRVILSRKKSTLCTVIEIGPCPLPKQRQHFLKTTLQSRGLIWTHECVFCLFSRCLSTQLDCSNCVVKIRFVFILISCQAVQTASSFVFSQSCGLLPIGDHKFWILQWAFTAIRPPCSDR